MAQGEAGGMSRGKKALLIGAGVLGLLLVLGLVAVWMFPAERVAALAADRAEETLDREVRIDAVRLRLFPRPAVALEGMAVSRHARPGSDQAFEPLLASVERVNLRPRILPLLRGDVVVNEVVIDGPNLLLDVPEGGTLDLPEMEGEESGTGDAELEIHRMHVRNGAVEYRDANTGTVVVIAGIDHSLSLSASVVEGELSLLELTGELNVERIDAELPETLAAPLRGLSLQVSHDAVLHSAEDRLELRTVDAVLGEFPFSLDGSVADLSEPESRTVSIEASANDVDVARLVASLPPELSERLPETPDGERITGTGGRVSLAATVTGRAGGEARPDVDGRLELDDVALGYEGADAGDVARDVQGELAFSLDSASTEGITGSLLDEPFELAFAIGDLADPSGRIALRGAVDLAEAERRGFLPEDVTASGRLALDVTGRGRASEPREAVVEGRVDLAGVELRGIGVEPPVRIAETAIELQGRRAVANDVRVEMGRSDLALDFEALDWLAFVLGDTTAAPRVTADARSGLLDVDELLGTDPEQPSYGQILFAHVGGAEIDGRSAEEIAEAHELALPEIPNMVLDASFGAARVVSGGLTYEGIEATATARERTLEIPAASFRVMDGNVQLDARLGAGPGPGADSEATGSEDPVRPFFLEYEVQGVTADPFLEHHTLFRGRVGGTLDLSGAMQMELRPNTLPVQETVTGDGTIEVRGGELRNWPLVRELTETLGVAEFETLAFQDWAGAYRIVGGRILIEESTLEAGDVGVRAAGSFDVAGNLDFAATFELPARWLSEVPGAPGDLLGTLLGGQDGSVPVGAQIGGTMSSPSISLDFSEAGATAQEQAQEEARDAVRQEADRLLDRFGIGRRGADTLPPPDSAARGDTLPPPDSVPPPDSTARGDTLPHPSFTPRHP